MAKIFLIGAVICGIAAAVFGYLVNADRLDFRSKWNTTTDNLNKTTKTLKDTTATLEETKKNLESTKSALDESTTKANQLQDNLTQATAKANDLSQKVADDEQKLTQAEADAQDLKTKLGAEAEATQQAQARVTELEGNLKTKTDDLAAANAEVARLVKLKENSLTGLMPPGVVGQVVSVNTNWNFVVLNIGELQGVVPNGELLISRHDGTYIGKVRVANTEKNTCVADILLESLSGKGPIQVGDNAGN